jgi:hypothetical protein
MHSMLAELATLETELAELERVGKLVADAPPKPKAAPGKPSGAWSRAGGLTDDDIDAVISSAAPPSIDDALEAMKRRAGAPSSGASAPRPTSKPAPSASGASRGGPRVTTVEDELAALKRKMQGAPPPKKK